MKELDGGFPIYILDDDTVLYVKKDINHVDYWYETVSEIVAKKHGLLKRRIVNLPYCQRRARVIKNKFYCGEKINKKLFSKIEKILGLRLEYVYDDHETRCEISVAEFKGHLN